jgi:hypothetical protein
MPVFWYVTCSDWLEATSFIDVVGRDRSVGTSTVYGAGRSEDRIPMGARSSARVQTGPGAHPASRAMGIGPLSRGKAAGTWR